jgi:hypothetical protein
MSAAALASLVLAGPVSADDVCLDCPGDRLTGIDNAFWKLSDKSLPGNTEFVFGKIGLTSFDKLEAKDFPGFTDLIFQKTD